MTLGYICPGLFIYKLYYVTHPSFGDHLDLFYISLYDYMLQVEYFFVDEQHTVLKLLVVHHVRDMQIIYHHVCCVCSFKSAHLHSSKVDAQAHER